MDTVTQIALGAAVGQAVLGPKIGRRALIWGAVCGLIPDLDVLVPLGDPVRSFTYHRSASHSIFVLGALAPLVVRLILLLHKDTTGYRKQWYLLVFAAFYTHVLLDCFTVYGTQVLWPLQTPPVMWSTIFIIDPAYTLPLVIGVTVAWVYARTQRRRGQLVNSLCLLISTAYLAWSVGVKLHVNQVAFSVLQKQQISYSRMLTTPAPFNTLLWRVLVMADDGYHEGFYSLLTRDGLIKFHQYPSDDALLEGIRDHWPVQRLKWFTQGFYSVKRQGNGVVVTDLRMGLEPDYVFRFRVADAAYTTPHPRPIPSQRIKNPISWDRLRWVWLRIWNERII